MDLPLRLAKKAALKSNHHHRHATIVFKGGAILAIGYNHHDRHSEINAIKKLWPSKRKGAKIFNFRLTFAGNIGISKPCADCQRALDNAGITAIWYTDRDGRVAKL